jgi:hypothetical protein
MYICDKHGELESEWCDDCKKIVACDCKDQTYTRFKDQLYDCEDGERTITMRLYHCETCGTPSHVEI